MSRKSPTINKTKICKNCGIEYLPTSTRQFYCKTCIPIMDKKRKLKHYLKSKPNAHNKPANSNCCICGDEFSSHFEDKPYCKIHYLRMYYKGNPNLNVYQSKNTYTIVDDYAILKTTKGQEFIVDVDDLELTQTRTWCIGKTGYLVASLNGKNIKLHRYLLGLTNPSDVVDHINRNPLDNRKSNLRICSQNENSKNTKLQTNNTTGYPGIKLKPNGSYYTRITVDYKEIYLGTFDNFEDAVKVRKAAERKYYGEFAPSKITS